MNARQVRDLIISPCLIALGLYSPSAVQLLIGTCSQESQMGKYIAQQGIGLKGGIGIYQMQKNAFDDIWQRVILPNVALRAKLRLFLGYEGKPSAERMVSDIALSTAMARLYYYAIPSALPDANDIPALAAFWKKFYNTPSGGGTEQEFIDNYKKYVII